MVTNQVLTPSPLPIFLWIPRLCKSIQNIGRILVISKINEITLNPLPPPFYWLELQKGTCSWERFAISLSKMFVFLHLQLFLE